MPPKEGDEAQTFQMYNSPDSWPYMSQTNSGRTGFFFSVTGVAEQKTKIDAEFGGEVLIPRTLKFHIKNMSNQAKLLSYGHTPVYLEVNNQDYIKLTKGKLPFYR